MIKGTAGAVMPSACSIYQARAREATTFAGSVDIFIGRSHPFLAEYHAQKAKQIGAYAALHTARSGPSYFQGIIKNYRVKARDRPDPAQPLGFETGIAFLLHRTGEPLVWVGGGSGKGLLLGSRRLD